MDLCSHDPQVFLEPFAPGGGPLGVGLWGCHSSSHLAQTDGSPTSLRGALGPRTLCRDPGPCPGRPQAVPGGTTLWARHIGQGRLWAQGPIEGPGLPQPLVTFSGPLTQAHLLALIFEGPSPSGPLMSSAAFQVGQRGQGARRRGLSASSPGPSAVKHFPGPRSEELLCGGSTGLGGSEPSRDCRGSGIGRIIQALIPGPLLGARGLWDTNYTCKDSRAFEA